MSAVARLSAVAGDDVAIVVRFPAGFTADRTFALELRRRNGALVHATTPAVVGDDAIIEIPAATSAAFPAGWLYGHLQVWLCLVTLKSLVLRPLKNRSQRPVFL